MNRSKLRSKYHLVRSNVFAMVLSISAFLYILFVPQMRELNDEAESTHYKVTLGNQEYGVVHDKDDFYEAYTIARQNIAAQHEEMIYTDFPAFSFEACDEDHNLYVKQEDLVAMLEDYLLTTVKEPTSKGCMIKVGDDAVYVASAQEALEVLETGLAGYDQKDLFTISVLVDTSTEFSALSPVVMKRSDMLGEKVEETLRLNAGAMEVLTVDSTAVEKASSNPYDQFDYGIIDMQFAEAVQLAEGYISSEHIVDALTAKQYLFDVQDTKLIYTVKKGDSLSGISMDLGLPLSQLISMNDSLENEHSTISVGQELLVTIPVPILGVYRIEEVRRKEAYDLPIEYVYNDDWYTDKHQTLRQPSSGFRDAVALVTYENDSQIAEEILYEEVLAEAVAKKMEVGTIVPPTYIKPLAGGRLSSKYGYRRSPGGIGSSFHRGIDWATPIGTPVNASCGGTVTQAGWSGGYGYCVVIRHPDGKQTRYAHLSRIYVSVGQAVSQGQCIAGSGNSGASTGPHLHFEILIGGNQVDPSAYVPY